MAFLRIFFHILLVIPLVFVSYFVMLLAWLFPKKSDEDTLSSNNCE